MENIWKRVIILLAFFFFVITFYYFYNTDNKDCIFTGLSTNSEDSSKRKAPVLTDYLTLNKIDNRSVPDVIFQFGVGRSATTLQFHIICIIMVLLHEDNADDVGCDFSRIPETKYKVIKSQSLLPLIAEVPDNTWLFMTSGRKQWRHEERLNSSMETIKAKHIVIPYIADFGVVEKLGYKIVYEYQKIFGLSDDQMENIAEYFRYWDILRICCGKQMSKHWRKVLHHRGSVDKTKSDMTAGTPHPCDIYNISKVEMFMMDTYIFKKFSTISSMDRVIGKPSISDDKLDGTYCYRCNENVLKNQLEFNDPCG